MGVVAAALGFYDTLHRPFTLASDDVDHTPNGVAAVKSGLGPSQYLDPFDVTECKKGEIEFAGCLGWIVDANAVDQHLCMVRIGAADVDIRRPADTAGLVDIQARYGLQQLRDTLRARGFDLLPADDGNGAADLVGG